MLAAGDLDEARRAADELARIAAAGKRDDARRDRRLTPGRGRVGRRDPGAALVALRQAGRLWQELDAPYEVARVRALVGLACRALGDEESAALELAAAREVFERLAAAPDLARIDLLDRTAPTRTA